MTGISWESIWFKEEINANESTHFYINKTYNPNEWHFLSSNRNLERKVLSLQHLWIHIWDSLQILQRSLSKSVKITDVFHLEYIIDWWEEVFEVQSKTMKNLPPVLTHRQGLWFFWMMAKQNHHWQHNTVPHVCVANDSLGNIIQKNHSSYLKVSRSGSLFKVF